MYIYVCSQLNLQDSHTPTASNVNFEQASMPPCDVLPRALWPHTRSFRSRCTVQVQALQTHGVGIGIEEAHGSEISKYIWSWASAHYLEIVFELLAINKCPTTGSESFITGDCSTATVLGWQSLHADS